MWFRNPFIPECPNPSKKRKNTTLAKMYSNGCVSFPLGLKIKDMDKEIKNSLVVEYQYMHY